MDKQRMSYVLVLLGVMILLAVLLFAQGTLRHSGDIVLPDPEAQGPNPPQEGEEQLELVEIRPDTVQRAVASMERPAAYSVTIAVETWWSGGSGTATFTAYTRDGVTRVDAPQLDGSVRRTVTDGETTWVWYDSETDYTAYAAGTTTADRELRVPTYEDLVSLPEGAVLAAAYTRWGDFDCICAEAAGSGGDAWSYFIDVDSGLLVAAQRSDGEEPIYRMEVQTLELTPPPAELFTLPDGTVLLPVVEAQAPQLPG